MKKNTLLAFLVSFIVLMIWSYYFNKPKKSVDSTPPVFNGLRKIITDKKHKKMKLIWNKARDKSPVAYAIFFNENNKVSDFSAPYVITTNTSYTITDLSLDDSYYFIVKAVDKYHNIDTNSVQLFHKGKGKKIISYSEKTFTYENKLTRYVFSTSGGRLKYITLKKFKNIDNDKKVELLYYNKGNSFYYPLGSILMNNNLNKFKINDNIKYTYKINNNKIIFNGRLNGIKIEKTYTFLTNSYKFYLTVKIKNRGPINFKKLVVKWQPTLGPVNKIDKYDKLEVDYYKEGSLESISFKGGFLKKGNKENKIISKESDSLKWVGFNNRYFVAAIIPVEQYRIDKALFFANKNKLIAGIVSKVNNKLLKENKELVYKYIIYAGPKARDTFRSDKEIASLESTIKFRKLFSKLGNWFLDILRFFDKIFHNYGIAILLFTFLIKLVLFPLTHKQFESMAKMQKIQPVINQIRAQFKDDSKRMNAELMQVYKKYKVNPFGGCLPMILQIPIFFAIWDMLQYSLELRTASFLWIKSLALPDTIGHLGSIAVNPLPIIMGATMIIQQKLSSGTDSNQKLMMYMMPLIFLFIFWSMPSGLVLYWTLQNVLSIFQQYYLNKKIKLNTNIAIGGKKK